MGNNIYLDNEIRSCVLPTAVRLIHFQYWIQQYGTIYHVIRYRTEVLELGKPKNSSMVPYTACMPKIFGNISPKHIPWPWDCPDVEDCCQDRDIDTR